MYLLLESNSIHYFMLESLSTIFDFILVRIVWRFIFAYKSRIQIQLWIVKLCVEYNDGSIQIGIWNTSAITANRDLMMCVCWNSVQHCGYFTHSTCVAIIRIETTIAMELSKCKTLNNSVELIKVRCVCELFTIIMLNSRTKIELSNWNALWFATDFYHSCNSTLHFLLIIQLPAFNRFSCMHYVKCTTIDTYGICVWNSCFGDMEPKYL